jgi:hypothetical protein
MPEPAMPRLHHLCACLLFAEGAVVLGAGMPPPTPAIAVGAPTRVSAVVRPDDADGACMPQTYAYARTVVLDRRLGRSADTATRDAAAEARGDLLDCLSALDADDELDMSRREWAAAFGPVRRLDGWSAARGVE